jgi:hypothetical protein
MRVSNISGTEHNKCLCTSWLNHWLKFSGDGHLASVCAEKRCDRIATLGAHVQKDGSVDLAWHIVPLCDAHNRQTGSFEIDESVTPPVSANVAETCGKKA